MDRSARATVKGVAVLAGVSAAPAASSTVTLAGTPATFLLTRTSGLGPLSAASRSRSSWSDPDATKRPSTRPSARSRVSSKLGADSMRLAVSTRYPS